MHCVYEVSKKPVATVRETDAIPVAADAAGQAVAEVPVLAFPTPHHGSIDTLGSLQSPGGAGDRDFAALDLSIEDVLAGSEMQDVFALETSSRRFDSQCSSSDMLFAANPDQQLHRSSPPAWMWSPTSIQPRLGNMEQAPWSAWTNSARVTSTLLTPELNKALSYSTGELLPALQLIRSSSAVVQHSTRLIIQGLRAYPMMVLRRETFPPFIHPHWHRQSVPSLPEPLASCMSIAHMYAFRTEETKPFLWRTIQAEDERFLAQVSFQYPGSLCCYSRVHSVTECPQRTCSHVSKRR